MLLLLLYTHEHSPSLLQLIGWLLTISVMQRKTGIVNHLISWNDRGGVHLGWRREASSAEQSRLAATWWDDSWQLSCLSMCGVCQRAGDWMERVKRRGWVWVWVCVRLLSCVESLPVSGRLSWVFFIWSIGAVSTAWGGYSLAWHGRVWSGLPAALWMREQQQVNQCIMQGTNKDFIPSSGTHLNVCTQTSWAWALFWFGCSWINPSVKLWNLWQSWLLCWFGLLCSLF